MYNGGGNCSRSGGGDGCIMVVVMVAGVVVGMIYNGGGNGCIMVVVMVV